MSVIVKCSCDKKVLIPDEYLGKRVKCPRCKEILKVSPEAETVAEAPRSHTPAPAGMVRFVCACGKEMQTRAEYAGQETQCPACSAVVLIPGSDEEGNGGARIQRDRPKSRRGFDDRKDLEEGTGKKRTGVKKKSALVPVLVSVVVLLVLIGGGIGAYFFLFRGPDKDLALIPGDAKGFVTLRLADLSNPDAAPKMEDLKKQNPDLADLPGLVKEGLGLDPADIERLSLVGVDFDKEDLWLIVSTLKPYDRDKLLSRLQGAQELTHEKKNYHLGTLKSGEKAALHFVNDRVLVVAPEQGMKSCLGHAAGKRRKGPLDEAIKRAGGKNPVEGANIPLVALPALLTAAQATALELIPGDAQGFVTVRVAELWKADAVQKALAALRKQNPQMPDLLGMMEKEIGLKPADVERFSAAILDFEGELGWGITSTVQPYDRKRILAQLKDVRALRHANKPYHLGTPKSGGDKLALHFVNDRMLVIAPEKGMKAFLSYAAGKKRAGPLDDVTKRAGGRNHLVAAVNLAGLPLKVRLMLLAATRQVPGARSLGDVRSVTVVLNVRNSLKLDLKARMPSDAKAVEVKRIVDASLAAVKLNWPAIKMNMGRQPGVNPAVVGEVEQLLESISVDASGVEVSIKMTSSASLPATLIASMDRRLPVGGPGVGPAVPTQTETNLKRLALAMHAYAAAHKGSLPPATISSADGRPLYSWRVELLPYLGPAEKALYNEFKKDEPWDSPHNKPLLARMPRVFALPGMPPGRTPYQVFTGANTPFASRVAPRFPADFKDGTSNTILIAEGNRLVNWTQPDDIRVIGLLSPRISLRNNAGKFHVVLADGSFRALKATISDKTLRNAINPRDGQPLGPDW
jgi:hypothetical protein